jgi:hypothetical protein
MFAGMAKGLTSNGAPEGYSTQVDSGPTGEHQTRLDELPWDKLSNLLGLLVSY